MKHEILKWRHHIFYKYWYKVWLLNKDFNPKKDTILTKLFYSNINFSKFLLSETTPPSIRNFQTFKHFLKVCGTPLGELSLTRSLSTLSGVRGGAFG